MRRLCSQLPALWVTGILNQVFVSFPLCVCRTSWLSLIISLSLAPVSLCVSALFKPVRPTLLCLITLMVHVFVSCSPCSMHVFFLLEFLSHCACQPCPRHPFWVLGSSSDYYGRCKVWASPEEFLVPLLYIC